MEDFNQNEFNGENSQKKRSPAFVGLIAFLSVVAVIIVLVWAVLIPLLNKNLSNIGINSVNDFIDFYKDINKYVAEEEVVDKPFESTDYANAYDEISDAGLDIFKDDEQVSDIDETKIDEYKESGFIDYGSIKLTDKQLAALFSNALKNKNLIEQLDVKIIEKYNLQLEVKELSIKKITKEDDAENDYFGFKTVGKVSLKEVASTLPWPYNGMIPDLVYVTIESTIKYSEDKVKFENCQIQINKVSEETKSIIIDVINSQIKDDETEPVTLDSLSKYLNELVYSKIENFAKILNGKIKMVLDENDVAFFEISYAE